MNRRNERGHNELGYFVRIIQSIDDTEQHHMKLPRFFRELESRNARAAAGIQDDTDRAYYRETFRDSFIANVIATEKKTDPEDSD